MGSTNENIVRRQIDGRHHIILRVPEKGNALSAALVRQLDQAFNESVAEGARLVVFEGEGKHFCTGFDLSGLDDETDASLLLRFVEVEKFLQNVHSSSVMTVAIGKGRCFGAGADLFASCDRRIALTGASFAFPGSAFGLILGTARLAGRIGRDNARKSLLAGTVFTDTAAASSNLATDLIDEADLASLLHECTTAAHRLDVETVRLLNAATDHADYDRELADLVRSASRPGIRDRVSAYRNSIKAR